MATATGAAFSLVLIGGTMLAPWIGPDHESAPGVVLVAAHARSASEPEPEADPGADPDRAPAETAEPDPVECIVHTIDHRRVSGLLVQETPDIVVVRVAGIETVIDKSRVDRIERLGSVEERYRDLRRTIDPKNPNQHLVLAEWLRDRERYEDALEHARTARGLDPSLRRAPLLIRWLEAQIALDRQPTTPTPALPAPPTRDTRNLLTPEQINLVRVYELDLRDPPRLNVDPGLVDALIEGYRDRPEMPATAEGRQLLRSARASRLVDLLFRLRARELYPMITVLDDPYSMARFRRDVNRGWLVNACATSRCHGGLEAGLRLRQRHLNSDTTVYSNFVAINQHRLRDGRSLIDPTAPENSPLLQMALVPSESATPHPEVLIDGRIQSPRAPFRRTDDRGYQRTLDWIRSLVQPRPDYLAILGERPLWPEPEDEQQGEPEDQKEDESRGSATPPTAAGGP